MRAYWRWWLPAIILVSAVATYVGLGSRMQERIAWLAGQPEVATAFQNPITARSDALTALIAFTVLTPIALFVAIVVFLIVVAGVTTLLVSLHLPGWLSAPLVAVIAIVTLYRASEVWMPAWLYGMGVVARAYLVYSSTGPA
jgi:hypothetical protein